MVINLVTGINNTPKVCFDLSRSIDLHKISTAHTKEKAIAGCTSGLIGLNEFVTWEAIHFGVKMHLTTKITEYDFPFHFRDEQIKGAFRYMKHDHYFETDGERTIMKDVFEFASPVGWIGKAVDNLIMKRYLTKLLIRRNAAIKEYAENGKWKTLLHKY